MGSNPTLSAMRFQISNLKFEMPEFPKSPFPNAREQSDANKSKAIKVLSGANMIKSSLARTAVEVTISALAAVNFFNTETTAQKRRGPVKHLSVCGDPRVRCKTIGTFDPNELPFRLPENAVIYDTELFYAIILKSVKAPDDTCDVFVPERERLAAQALFPDHKVFSSRCAEPGEVYYTNIRPNVHLMAVYAGNTLVEANRMLAAVSATGKFPDANIRRMRAGFNGT